MNKIFSTLNIPAPDKPGSVRQAQWAEARMVFPIYLALAKQSQLEIPFPQNKRVLPEKPDLELSTQVDAWLESMDQRVLVYELRHLLQMTTLNASESGLRALIQRHLRKPAKSVMDRDKIDFLLVQYFALCAPAKIYHKQIELPDVAMVMKPVLGDVDTAPLSWCEPLERMIEVLRGFRSLREILQTSFIDQGRKVKETAGEMFYDPSAMLAFVRFNFLLRRTLIELMHADLTAIRSGITRLEAAGAGVMDCHHLELSDAEPLNKIRQIADQWNQPFQKEYTERSVSQAFEKLLGLRTDVERALEKVNGKATATPAPVEVQPTEQARASAPAKSTANAIAPSAPASTGGERAASAPPKKAEPAAAVLDFEACLEKIWEQLIAAPPARGRSMSTVHVGSARVLMSSWEVSAFVSEDGPAAEDLRRAVVARALVTAATEAAKETGQATGLDEALSVARVEVSRLQERVDVAKQAKNTEAAVNLGISTKRLLSALDEAEKL